MKKTSTNVANFKEFSVEAKNNMFSGRIYIDNPKQTDKCWIWPLSLNINGLSIVGAKLWVSKDKQWISMPQYKSGEEWKSICFFVDKADNEDLAALANELKKLIEEK